MSELGQLSVTPEVKKAAVVDVVKIGDSERRRPEEVRAVGVVGATMEFLGDLGKANLAAKKELGELASDRISKVLLVGAIGGGMELVAESAFKTALQIIKPVLPTTKPALDAIKHVIDQQKINLLVDIDACSEEERARLEEVLTRHEEEYQTLVAHYQEAMNKELGGILADEGSAPVVREAVERIRMGVKTMTN